MPKQKLDIIDLNILISLLCRDIDLQKHTNKWCEIPKYQQGQTTEEKLLIKLRKMLREI